LIIEGPPTIISEDISRLLRIPTSVTIELNPKEQTINFSILYVWWGADPSSPWHHSVC